MKLKKPTFKIDENDPFQEDRLNRKESAEILTDFIKTIDDPFVLSLTSPWGTGKTIFIKMWKQFLENCGFKCLYFNAWENDHSDEPFIAIMGEIQTDIISSLGNDSSKAKEYFEKAKAMSGKIARRALPVAIKLMTSGLLNLDDVTEEVLAEFASDFAQEQINQYEVDKKTLKQFKKTLQAFAKEIGNTHQSQVIFFIDELDRCKPPYAIALMERLKHLFSIPGFVFIVAIDKDEFANSVKAEYGIADSDGYLRRFIDLEYQLPSTSTEDYCQHLFNKFGFEEYFSDRRYGQHEGNTMVEVFSQISEMFNFSLRQQDQAFTQFNIVLRTTKPESNIQPELLAFLIGLKSGNPKLYNSFTGQKADWKEILTYIESLPKGVEFIEENPHLKAALMIAFCSYEDGEKLVSELVSQMQIEGLADKEKNKLSFLVNLIQDLRRKRSHNLGKHLTRKIEISEPFVQN